MVGIIGANSGPFRPQITSYDFAAPISENGELTDKYYAIKATISEVRTFSFGTAKITVF